VSLFTVWIVVAVVLLVVLGTHATERVYRPGRASVSR
jgi:Sec-independent protein translocase protein TatA